VSPPTASSTTWCAIWLAPSSSPEPIASRQIPSPPCSQPAIEPPPAPPLPPPGSSSSPSTTPLHLSCHPERSRPQSHRGRRSRRTCGCLFLLVILSATRPASPHRQAVRRRMR
jgi:hypothetical protein